MFDSGFKNEKLQNFTSSLTIMGMKKVFNALIHKCLSLWGSSLLAAGLLGTSLFTAHAQGELVVMIRLLKTDTFPSLQILFEIYDAEGNFVPDILPADVKLVESGITRPLAALKLVEPGLQTLVAINNSPGLSALSDDESYLAKVINSLQNWAGEQPINGLDDYSLIDNTGLQVIRSTNIQEWAQVISTYQPELQTAQQGLASLNMALDLAVDPNPRENMKRSILYITPPPLAEHGLALPNLTDRAVQQGVQINVWLVPSNTQDYPQGIELLKNMAQATGGNFLQLSAGEELPNISAYLQPLRFFYQGEYLSGINDGGTQSVMLEVVNDGIQAASTAYSFSVDVSPPNPIFLSPPTQVVRSWIEGADQEGQVLEPATTPIRILVEFQDGYARDLASTALYVNGEKADENITPPFDQFSWSLDGISETGIYNLQVEAIDILGLSQKSITQPVDVVVEQKAISFIERIATQGVLPVFVGISFAGVIVVSIIFFVSGKSWFVRKNQKYKPLIKQPVTQPAAAFLDDNPARTNQGQSLTWPVQKGSQNAPARLIPLSENGTPLADNVILVNRSQITLGSDPKQATHILRSNTVHGLHARLIHGEQDSYILSDAGSIAGTWVNYAPVSLSGQELKHGDLIHIGQFMFRFELRTPPTEPRIKVYPMNDGKLK